MLSILFGIFLMLHGLVHLLYVGHSVRFFELQPGMNWPDGSWVFSRLLGNISIRYLASFFLVLAAIAFIVGGIGVFIKHGWLRPVILAAAILSSAIFILFWDGGWQHLDNKGGFAILINLAIAATMLIFRFPTTEF